jgi:hypothetical protein
MYESLIATPSAGHRLPRTLLFPHRQNLFPRLHPHSPITSQICPLSSLALAKHSATAKLLVEICETDDCPNFRYKYDIGVVACKGHNYLVEYSELVCSSDDS